MILMSLAVEPCGVANGNNSNKRMKCRLKMFPMNFSLVIKQYEDQENILKSKLQMLSNTDARALKEERQHTGEYLNFEHFHFPSPKTVRTRNSQLLKEIEMSRARIRSLSLYSPLESVLRNAILNYVKHMTIEIESDIDILRQNPNRE